MRRRGLDLWSVRGIQDGSQAARIPDDSEKALWGNYPPRSEVSLFRCSCLYPESRELLSSPSIRLQLPQPLLVESGLRASNPNRLNDQVSQYRPTFDQDRVEMY